MKPSAYYDRVVDVMEELVKFTLLTRDVAPYLVDRYSERKETAVALSAAREPARDLASIPADSCTHAALACRHVPDCPRLARPPALPPGPDREPR